MAYKERSVPVDLAKYRIIAVRMELSSDERLYYYSKEKGFQGEMQFDLLTNNLQSDGLVLNDLRFEVNNSECQLDTAIIFSDPINVFEVKNYEGNFIYKPDKLVTTKGKEYANPLDQLKRSKLMLSQLLQDLGCDIPIEGYVVFINPEFTLYDAPQDKPFIFPTQLNALLKKLNSNRSKLTLHHKALADKLISLHKTESKYSSFSPYSYEGLRKGVTCKDCWSFNIIISMSERKLACNQCKSEEKIDEAVLRCVKEIKLLFPEKRITTNCVHEWCGEAFSKKQINRILTKEFRRVGHGKYSYYE